MKAKAAVQSKPAVRGIFANLLQALDARQRDVIVGRFGLEGREPQTLAEIGIRYGITRERVRQIEKSALHALRKGGESDARVAVLARASRDFLRSRGGASRDADFVAQLASVEPGFGGSHAGLLLEMTGAYFFHPEDNDFWPFYYESKPALAAAKNFVAEWVKALASKKSEVLGGKYQAHFSSFVSAKRAEAAHAESYLGISKKIHTNPYGDTGLADWPEIKPQAIRDRIYLVLKKKGAPLHFRDIAEEIRLAKFDARETLVPTVHNELIKDARFVLVGRGMYALAEHGYEPGTAREVIARILKSRGPMRPREVISEIQKERFFKPNTVLVNLQNKSNFHRRSDGTYTVREA